MVNLLLIALSLSAAMPFIWAARRMATTLMSVSIPHSKPSLVYATMKTPWYRSYTDSWGPFLVLLH